MLPLTVGVLLLLVAGKTEDFLFLSEYQFSYNHFLP